MLVVGELLHHKSEGENDVVGSLDVFLLLLLELDREVLRGLMDANLLRGLNELFAHKALPLVVFIQGLLLGEVLQQCFELLVLNEVISRRGRVDHSLIAGLG